MPDNLTYRCPRTLEQAFGPHCARTLTPPRAAPNPPPHPADLAVCAAGVAVMIALALMALGGAL